MLIVTVRTFAAGQAWRARRGRGKNQIVKIAITLQDIAREAGVSVMTVSRAIRRQGRVAPAVQARILAIAQRLGYRPNPLISALMSQRRAGKPFNYDLKLGFVTNFTLEEDWRQFRLYREFYEGAALRADQYGYQLEEFWLAEPGMTPHRLSQILRTRNIHGVLLAPLPGAQGRMDLDWTGLSAVAFGYSIVEPVLHRVANHQFRSICLAMQRLRDLGYQRPGLALPVGLDERVAHQWLGGFLVEQRYFAAPPPPAVFLVPDADWTAASFQAWLSDQTPDVVIGHRTELLDWLAASGRRIPDDIGFVHLDCAATSGQISGIYQNGLAIGAAGADSLVAMLARNERGVPELPRTVLIQGDWAPGTTVRKQPLRKTTARD